MIPLPDSYTVHLVDLPLSEHGMVSEAPDGHIDLFVNARLSSAGQLKAALHEYEHWLHDDFNNDDDIQTVEGRARQKRDKLSRIAASIKRASEIPSPARHSEKQKTSFHSDPDWKDDILHRMEYRQ